VPAKPILVIGAGGHGKVVADVAYSAGFKILGYLDRNADKLGSAVVAGRGKVMFTDDTLPPTFLKSGKIRGKRIAVALGIGDNAARLRYADMLAAAPLPALVHKSATVSGEAVVEGGAVVMAQAAVNPGARICRGAVVNTSAVVEHDCVLGEGAHLGPGAVLCGNVHIGKLAFVGAQAVVIPGVRIGEGATVGAGCVVLKDVPAGATVVGNPARPKRS